MKGERIDGRCVRTPTGSLWVNTHAVDSGSAFILSSNLAHLQRESLRTLVTAIGPGTITNEVRGYAGLIDVAPPDTAPVGIASISWASSTARRFGPFYMIPDGRKLKVAFHAEASNMRLYFAVTPPSSDPLRGFYLFREKVASTTDFFTETVAFPEPFPVPPQSTRCRTTDAVSSVLPVDIWIGWYGVSGTNRLLSYTVYEVE